MVGLEGDYRTSRDAHQTHSEEPGLCGRTRLLLRWNCRRKRCSSGTSNSEHPRTDSPGIGQFNGTRSERTCTFSPQFSPVISPKTTSGRKPHRTSRSSSEMGTKFKQKAYQLIEEGIPFRVQLHTRSDYRKLLEGTLQGSSPPFDARGKPCPFF